MKKLKVNDIVRIVNSALDARLSKSWNINEWRIVLFPADGDNAAIIENLRTHQQTFIALSELEAMPK